MNWDNIKYLFQIPVSWFRKIHDRVFKAYGTNFIVVKSNGEDGGMHIDVDYDAFQRDVNDAVDGVVRSVDGLAPDDSGDVQLSYVETVNGEPPDDDGDVDVDVGVLTIDNASPDANGNINLSYVKTVNSTPPDANGNVNVNADTSTCLKQSDWMNVNSQYSVCPYYYANAGYTGNLPAGVTNLYQWVGALTYNSLDAYIDSLGYLTESDLTSYVQEDDLGDLAFLDNVTVDGHSSDSNGNVSFGLTASKWVKTDSNGHLTTTNDQPVTVDTSQYTPQTTNLTVVTAVHWSGTKLQYKSKQLQFQNGVLVNVANESTTDIDTPTVVAWHA